MAKEREVFIHGQVDENGNIIVPGCVRNGIDEVSANKIFDEMAEFAKYAFNKSHAACYAVVSYETAYLKAYYPPEFMAAMLNSYLGNLDKVPVYIDECKSLNIDILKPSINESELKFKAINGNIRFGLGSIKNVGITPVENIIKERNEHGKYESFTDFCERIADLGVNKKCIESLIKSGAFDEFSQNRSTLLESFEGIVDTIQSSKKKGLEGQFSMFDLGSDDKENNLEKQRLKDELSKLKEKSNTAIILVTHDLGVVANFADRIQVMYAGQVVERGTAREIFYESKHPYTWALLSSVPKVTNESKEELYALKGTPPDLLLPLHECPFASRCEYCMGICKERNPMETSLSDTHKVSCWLQHPKAPKVKSFYDKEAK